MTASTLLRETIKEEQWKRKGNTYAKRFPPRGKGQSGISDNATII